MIAIYLNDHLAGATAGLELARRARGEYPGTDLGAFLTGLADEIEEDRETLERLMARVDAGPDRLKLAAAWAAEKVGRLKLNGRLRGQSPLSPLVELEGLALGISAKAGLWRMLRELGEPRLAGTDFDALVARAERQLAELEGHRIAAGRAALRSDGD